MRHVLHLVFVVLMYCFSAGVLAIVSGAQEKQNVPPEKTEPPEPVTLLPIPKQDKPKRSLFDRDRELEVEREVDGADIEIDWLDDFHESLSDQFDGTAQQIDDFFGDDEDIQNEDAKAEARLKLGWEPRSGDFSEFDVRFRIRMSLPKLANRVDLLFTDIEEDAPDSSVKAGRDEIFTDQDPVTLSLRYRVSPNSKISTKVGFGRTDQVFVRTRYRDFGTLTDKLSYRYESSINYYSQDRFGADVGATLDYEVNDHSVFRFRTKFFYRDDENLWRWRHYVENLRILDDQSALIYGMFLDGSDEDNFRLNRGLISARWRKNALRRWLYFELEPFVVWYREEDFRTSYGLAMRVEGYYGKF